MPRIRTIKPEFWGDEKLAPMEPITRLVFLGLISMADDAGRLLDSVKQIDAMLFPLTEDSARESLAILSRTGRIQRGTTASGQRVIQIVNWRHQRVDHPNMSAALPKIVQQLTEDSRPPRDEFPSDSRDIRDSISTSTNDLRPTTNDLRPTIDDRGTGGFRELVANRLQGDLDRRALTTLLEKVQNPESWCAEMNAALDGMGGHILVTPAQLGSALREYVANANGDQPKIRHFKGYLSSARAEPQNGTTPKQQSGSLLDRARVILSIAAQYDLLSYYGNAVEYRGRIDEAAMDPRAGPGFREEIAPLKLYDGIGKQETHFAERELVKRMQAAAQAVPA